MGILIGYEFKKLLKSKANIITMIAGIGLLFLLLFSSYQSDVQDEDGCWLYGKEAVDEFSRLAKQFEGPVTNESIAKNLTDYKKWVEENNITSRVELQNSKIPGYEFARAHRPYTNFILDFLGIDLGDLKDMDLETDIDFYQMFRDNFRNCLDSENKDIPWNLSEKEKEYWMDKANGVDEIYFGNTYVWRDILEMSFCLVFVTIIIIVLVSTTYNREYSCKTDAILLTTKYGKNKLINAKNIAAFLYIMTYYTICVLVFYIVEFARYGREGFNTSVYAMLPKSVLNITVFQASLIQVAVAYATIFLVSSIVLFLSARIKHALVVCLIGILIEFCVVFMQVDFSYGSFANHFLCLTPVQLMFCGFSRPLSYNICGVVLNIFQFGIGLYVIIGIIFFILAGKGFKVRHE